MFRLWFKRPAKGNVSVEFALITALFTLPLLIGATDFVTIIAGQAQLNTALQALYYYAVTNANTAITTGTTPGVSNIITLINANSNFQITLATPSWGYLCYTTTTTGTADPGVSGQTPSTTNCSASGKTTMTFAQYTVSASVPLPIKLPLLSNPLTLTASGYVQVN